MLLCLFLLFLGKVSHGWIWNDIGRNCLLGNRKKIAKFLIGTFTWHSTFLYGSTVSNNKSNRMKHCFRNNLKATLVYRGEILVYTWDLCQLGRLYVRCTVHTTQQGPGGSHIIIEISICHLVLNKNFTHLVSTLVGEMVDLMLWD